MWILLLPIGMIVFLAFFSIYSFTDGFTYPERKVYLGKVVGQVVVSGETKCLVEVNGHKFIEPQFYVCKKIIGENMETYQKVKDVEG